MMSRTARAAQTTAPIAYGETEVDKKDISTINAQKHDWKKGWKQNHTSLL